MDCFSYFNKYHKASVWEFCCLFIYSGFEAFSCLSMCLKEKFQNLTQITTHLRFEKCSFIWTPLSWVSKEGMRKVMQLTIFPVAVCTSACMFLGIICIKFQIITFKFHENKKKHVCWAKLRFSLVRVVHEVKVEILVGAPCLPELVMGGNWIKQK